MLGKENKATGAPIKIGISSLGKSPQIDNTGEMEAARAAADYVNDYLGGVNGRPLEIVDVCQTKAQPSLARDCANKFVQSDAVAVLSGPEPNATAIVDVTSKSKMPFVNFNPDTVTQPNSYVLPNTLAFLVGAPAAYAQEQGFKKVSIVTFDVPSAVEPLKQAGALAYGNAGVKSDVVAVPLGTADQTPQIQAALKGDPDMFSIVGDPAFCTGALKALRTLNVDKPIMVVGQCIGDSALASQIPGGYDGLLVSTETSTDPGQEETKVFDAVIDKYTDAKIKTGTAPTGYQVVLGFARALSGMTGTIDRRTVAAYLGAMPSPQPMPLGAGSTFQCGSKPVAIAPNICSPEGMVGIARADGALTDVKSVDVTDLLQLPPG
ncbi:ABC transporter substrate-binding protein [Marmoricola sp. RAF53]|uniref:ABC transporter substrate-binding protein n=1 Tax=Marmoricola sp. RAF53 TaxID=3233059 RepID=UPI003F9627E1